MIAKREGRFIREIRKAVREGWLKEPFRANDVRLAVPGFADKTYNVFLPKHRIGNPDENTELFVQIKKGLYRLK
jgi:hypothetical protein